MSEKLKNQRRAIGECIRERQKDLIIAKNANNQEWIDACNFDLEHLRGALDSLKDLETLLRILRQE